MAEWFKRAFDADRVMNVLLFGATGMVGRALGSVALRDPRAPSLRRRGLFLLPRCVFRWDERGRIRTPDVWDHSGSRGSAVPLDPRMTFIYVSSAGTDSSEHGRIMWASV